MIESKTQVFTYRNEFGERLQLVVDLERESGVLSSADFAAVSIKHDRFLNSGLILARDESEWVAGVWKQLFHRQLHKLPFNLFEDVLRQVYESLSPKQRQRLFG